MDAESDKEMRKMMILKCLKLEIELKKLEKELQVKRKKNAQLKRHNKMLKDKIMLFKVKPFGDYQYQDMVEMKNCIVKLEDVDRKQEDGSKRKTVYNVEFRLQNSQLVCQHSGCGKRFKHKDTLRHHQYIHLAKIQCQVCQMCFQSPTNLQKHFIVHSGERLAQRPFVCDWVGCGYRSALKSDTKKHIIQVHSDERPFHCNRNGCGKSFKRNGDLKLHATVHSSLRLFKCRVSGCDKRFKRKRALKTHMDLPHREI